MRKHSLRIAIVLCAALAFWPGPIRRLTLAALRFPFTLARSAGETLLLLPRLPALKRENVRLKRDLMRRHLEIAQLEEFVRHTAQTQKLLDILPQTEGQIANVIGRSPIPAQEVMLLDRGGLHGIEVGTVVLDAYGVVGRVIEHTATTSMLLLISDRESRIAVYVERTREKGLLVGKGLGGSEVLYLDADSSAGAGDRIMTAGLGGPFPKGLLVGEIRSVARDAVRGTTTALIRPAAALDRLEEVFCLAPENTVTVF